MYKKLAPIQQEAHKNAKIKPISSYDFAKGFHLATVNVNEFPRAAGNYPIVFLKVPNEENVFRPVALFGTNEGENVFITEDGNWDAPYVPAIMRRYPFGVISVNQEDGSSSFAICVDEESEAYNEEEGQALFDAEGQPTEFFGKVREFLTELQKNEAVTQNFCDLLVQHNLLTEQTLNLTMPDGQKKRLSGFYLINEKAFNDLPDQVFLDLRHKGALEVIYSQLSSLAQVTRLIPRTK